MKKTTRIFLAAVILVCGAGLRSGAEMNLDDKSTLEARIALELSTILDKFLGAEKSHVTVFVDAEAEEIGGAAPADKNKAVPTPNRNKKGKGSLQQWLWKDLARKPKVSVMPGFMLPQEVTVTEAVHKNADRETPKTKELKPEKPAAEPAIMIRIKRVVVSVVLDRSVSDQDLEKVKVLAAEILGLDPDRGDLLNVYRLSFVPWWKQLFTSAAMFERILPFLLWGFMAAGIILLSAFLVQRQLDRWMGFAHPGKKVTIIKTPPESATPADGPAAVEGALKNKNTEAKEEETEEEKPVELTVEPGFQKPFAYINPQNIERLATLLQELGYPASSIAIVLGFLPIELRTAMLQYLDPRLQQDVMQLMCKMHKVAPEMLLTFDAQLKETIAHSYGGIVDTTEWMEEMPAAQCEAYLSFLEKVDSAKAQAIRNRLIRFEDLLILPAEQLPTLVHAVPVKEWGVALSGTGAASSPILAIMPEESQNVLRQRLALEHLSPETVMQARSKILSQARELAHQGRLKLTVSARAQQPAAGLEMAIERTVNLTDSPPSVPGQLPPVIRFEK
ncbi:MAG: FliG C-terminal domain-containing protein [Elusimicrobiales bacterium]|jgi:flagellar motor switch protein FliG